MSRTDCVSMEAIRPEGLSEALTNDEHFKMEGFTCLVDRSQRGVMSLLTNLRVTPTSGPGRVKLNSVYGE